MRKIIILIFLVLTIAANTNAQQYSVNKNKYDYRLYTPQYGDPNNPAISGVCSFLIPGLGQMVSGEVGRGLGFLGGYAGCGVIYVVGFAQYYNSLLEYNNNYSKSFKPSGVGTMLLGLGGMAAVSIWSIVDAVKVAKVNNMYIQDVRKKSAVSMQFAPYIEPLTINNDIVVPVGLSMRINF
ncbi:MAG: hypothetical protein WCG93_04925 [Paludibacter sp.]